MNPDLVAVLAVLVGILIGLAVFAFVRSLRREAARGAQKEAEHLRLLLEEVKDIAWEHRDLSPDLSTIIIDTIRTREQIDRRRQLP